MAYLSLSVLGSFQATLGGAPVTDFESDKVRALLAYLAVEAHRPHRRDALAGLLWPDWSNRAARTNLRNALANLRAAIGDRSAAPPYLLISRDTLRFNRASDHWLDVAAFRSLVAQDPPVASDLEEAVALYHGCFLESFFLKGASAFDDWSLLTRERLQRQALAALRWLAAYYEQRGEYGRSRAYAWREVELEPWREEAHRQLMRLLALSGRRGAALAQYETCHRLLGVELRVEPAEETTRLYNEIRDGTFSRAADERTDRGAFAAAPASWPTIYAATLPSFLSEERAVEAEEPVFVARERELDELDAFLDMALAGEGRVVFVTGEAGSGKTALVQAFTRRAQEAGADLIVASGKGNAYTGIGDPYLPFRQILQLLTGDVEAQWAAGAITREHARRLWSALPLAAQALLEAGPDLIDTFVPGTVLMRRATVASTAAVESTAAVDSNAGAAVYSGADWLSRLGELVERKAAGPGGPGPQQSALFEQYTSVLRELARQCPLVLVVDDLQWADVGSISLLFHLGRQLAGSRILIVGAYRPEEVALGRPVSSLRVEGIERARERHPLEPVVNELQRDFGDITVDLDRAAGRGFVEAFLDTEPNRLRAGFRETLYRQTRGQPLFTIELLRGLRERGDLVQDREGRWVEGPQLDWETLPARVEAVIAERIGRLTEPQRQMLRAASVEGETFTAEAVAGMVEADGRETLINLSGDLDRRHRLVRAETILRMDDQRLSRYRFRHILFQNYLYNSLDEVERMRLHEDVGNVLERLYGDRVEGIVVELAHHFQEAGITEKAVHYLHQAGTQAVLLSANEEAIRHCNRALALLETLPKSSERDRQELSLQLALAAPHQAARGYAAPETGRAYARAYELCQQMGETPELLPALWSLGSFYFARAEHEKSIELTKRVLSLVQQTDDGLQEAMAIWGLGVDMLHVGEFEVAREYLEHVITFYDPEQHGSLALTFGQDPGVSALAWASWALWFLGYPDQAQERSREALELGRKVGHLFSLGFALNIAGSLFDQLRREDRAARDWNEAMMHLATEEGFPLFQILGTTFQGWTEALGGEVEAGITQMRQGLAAWQAMGTGMERSHLLALLAQAYTVAGRVEQGLGATAEALDFVERSGERYYEAEIQRLRGELMLQQSDENQAEDSFHRAIEVAREQQAKSWELRATVSLCRLWQEQGKGEEARQRLTEIYGWFTEGFDTPDLKDARALLEELSS